MADSPIPYTRDELFNTRTPKSLTDRFLDQVAFPIGGIGAGCLSLSGRGELIDWEIFSRPGKGYRPEMTFFSLWAKSGREAPVFRVLEQRQPPPYHGPRESPYSSGPEYRNAAGLPRIESVAFTGRFPVARIDFRDKALPLEVSLEAWNPFIPTNAKDSSIPVALFTFHVTNPGKHRVRATLAMNLQNRCGHPNCAKTRNEYFDAGGMRGLAMSQAGYDPYHPLYGTMLLGTTWRDVTWTCQWPRVGGMGGLQHFCNTMAAKGCLDDDQPIEPDPHRSDVGSLGLKVNLGPGKSAELRFLVAWHIPWHEKYWNGGGCCQTGDRPRWKNYYATVWPNALAVGAYTVDNLDRLERETFAFRDALHGSTLPAPALDAVASQISILKSPTCLRLEDGTFYGWEGCCPDRGCCQGTCTHVWNYAQALPYLFPSLERSIRDAHFAHDLREEDGHMDFRMPLPLGTQSGHTYHAAADGQLGDVLKVYRDYLVCGDLEWLRGLWPRVKKALEYAWKEWDADKDGILDGVHHNTYDIEFHGAEPLGQTFYLGALRAGEELARAVGDTASADEYRRVFEEGRNKANRLLWNGEYFHQVLPAGADTRWQYGKGCLADQLIGQWYARMLGLGDLLDPAKVRTALAAIFRHNWRADLTGHVNPQRIYALNDEAGLLLCTWPKGGRPEFPFFYSDEVWTGIEYQVAAHMIYEGLVQEGLAIVTGTRRRHDGWRRNPYNEFECGNHYARAMASWSLLLALAGFSYSAPERRIGFSPRVSIDNFSAFFSVESGWGMFHLKQAQRKATATLNLLHGGLTLTQLDIGSLDHRPADVRAQLGGALSGLRLDVEDNRAYIRFAEPIHVTAETALRLTLT